MPRVRPAPPLRKSSAAWPEEVFPSSTGIIGVPLPAEKVIAALPALAAQLGPESDHFQEVAQAILTTDTVEKTAFARLEIGGKEVRIAALCKGSGMIHPQLVPHATMLVYMLTDAAIEPPALNEFLLRAVETSFNRISVDGDTSTNDTVLLLASGASGVTIDSGNAEFALALTLVCTSLAKQIVADGEGITHVVELRIDGAATDADALRVAKAIAHSPLVKTAWAGSDPNWGRLVAAIGYSGAAIDPERIDIWFGTLRICRDGGRAEEFDEAAAHALPQAARVFNFNPAQSRRGLVRLLDDRSDRRVRAHQRRLLDIGGSGIEQASRACY